MDVRRIETTIRDSVQTVGLTVAEYVFSEPRRVRLVVDNDTGVSVQDCVRATHAAEEALRVSGYDPEDFTINVESPGLDRKLSTPHDFERFRGKEVRVTFLNDIDGRRRVTGILGPVTAERIELTEQKRNVSIDRTMVREVRLFTSFGLRHH
ncbi:MAG: hypothetical protein HYR85_25915 [Planctomycetes bacterium]|nr:hypothetical protein [Planctomycetota bacterium]MBI3848037.1 hypothetical protein [Planctomycetota bacterium]